VERLEALGKYFQGGQSESEKSIMNDIFVVPKFIDDIIDFTLLNYKIIIGPKGSGKSLLVDYLNESNLMLNKLSIVIRPIKLDLEEINSKSITSEKIKSAKNQIYRLISEKIGEVIKSAETMNEKIFKEIAMEQMPDSLSKKIGQFINTLLPKDYKKLVDAFINIQKIDKSKIKIDKNISQYLKDNNKKLLLLIDDVDKAVEEDGIKFQYGSSWAIIEAATEIANEIDNVAVLITVRTDIWHLMTKVQKLGSTIYDKIGDIYNLLVDEEWIADVFHKRIVLCYRETASENRPTYEYGYFFQPDKINFYGKHDISRSWEQWIAKNTRNRPRDMIRLIQMLIKESRKINNNNMDGYITEQALHNILNDYAEERVKNIKQEYIQIFPKIDEVIMKLKQTKYSFSEMKQFLTNVCGIGIEIDGIPINNTNEKEKFKILKILHMASVINPRIDALDDTYRHILFEEDNNYIDPNNISKLQNCTFQVHPTFHSLIIK
jgi:hypothetical protein